MIGFVFASSPRMISPFNAGSIIEQLNSTGRLSRIKTAGVFVNEIPSVIESILRDAHIDFAQIHGDESPALTASYQFAWYRAMRVANARDFDRLSPFGGTEWNCPMIFADAYVKGLYGGTGVSIPYETALYVKEKVHAAGKEFFIAGGIDASNAGECITRIVPDGIDVSSGIETSPGKKSHAQMRKFFAAVNLAARSCINASSTV
jgi:phosphoribosylanthranilate isomerase